MEEQRCDKHPKYKGLRKPKSCEICMAIYEANKKLGIKERRNFKGSKTTKAPKVDSEPENDSHLVEKKEENPIVAEAVIGPCTDPMSCEDYYPEYDTDEEQEGHDEPEDLDNPEDFEDDVPDEEPYEHEDDEDDDEEDELAELI